MFSVEKSFQNTFTYQLECCTIFYILWIFAKVSKAKYIIKYLELFLAPNILIGLWFRNVSSELFETFEALKHFLFLKHLVNYLKIFNYKVDKIRFKTTRN